MKNFEPRFTTGQYQEAIELLEQAKTQLIPDGQNCVICGDCGHQAFECGRNPLVAMALCWQIANQSAALHETLHHLSGYNSHMGEQTGPARIILPIGGERVTAHAHCALCNNEGGKFVGDPCHGTEGWRPCTCVHAS